MPIFIHCDICKRVMGETDANRLKKFRKLHGERCEECKRIYEHIDEFTKRLKKIQVRKMEELFAELRQDVETEIRRVVESPPPPIGAFRRCFRYLFGEKPQEAEEQDE